MIEIPERFMNEHLNLIILHNVMDSHMNILGDRWQILLCSEKSYNDPNKKIPSCVEESIFIRLHSFDCPMVKRSIAVMLASAWLYDNDIWFDKIYIQTSR